MQRIVTIVATLTINAIVASSVFAGDAAAPVATPRAAQTASAATGFGPAAFASFVQTKGARPDSAVQGAVKIKLFNEFAQAPATAGTAAAADVAGIASLLPSKNAAIQGMLVAGQNNAVLQHGLTARK